MDFPRGPSLALPISSSKSHLDRRRSVSHMTSYALPDSPPVPRAMAIPGVRYDDAPPPLPPPRHFEDLADGDDIAWRLQNAHRARGGRPLASVKPGSSLLGGVPHGRVQGRDPTTVAEGDEDLERKEASLVAHGRAPQAEWPSASHIPNLVRRPPSPGSMHQRLQGEKPLAQHNHNQSSHAYDQQLLSKIGKSNSPPRHTRSGSTDKFAASHKLSIQTRDSKAQRLSPTGSPSTSDQLSRWTKSPLSVETSPSSRVNWQETSMDRQRAVPDPGSNTSSFDSDSFVSIQPRPAPRPTSGLVPATFTDTRSRSDRGSHDSAIYGGDGDGPGDDVGLRGLHIEERERRESKPGMKRRALSPPSEITREQRPEQFQRLSTGFAPPPNSRYPSKHGSISSTASSVRHGSLASSATFSVAPSSLTSVSSIDTHTPLDASQTSACVVSNDSAASPAASGTPLRQAPELSVSRKMSVQSAMNDTRTPPAKVGNYFMCSCCPKKPKKFETEEQLRVHENEKQYSCAFCHNRFKNKNEAERHQNSLHVRKHSWSCAATSNPQAVFHPHHPANSAFALYDICGFCGEEFPTEPADWDQRMDHLTNVHKYRECNHTKKFFRADHFRQHLKHSHGGKSGKWTNILEQSCLRDETSESASQSPTASEHSQGGSSGRGPSSLPAPSDVPMGGMAIDESREES